MVLVFEYVCLNASRYLCVDMSACVESSEKLLLCVRNVCVSVCSHCVYEPVYQGACVPGCVCSSVPVFQSVCVCVSACINICNSVCMYMQQCLFGYVTVCVCVCVCVCVHV